MASMDRLLRHHQTKEAETDRPTPNDAGACPLYPFAGSTCLPILSCVVIRPTTVSRPLLVRVLFGSPVRTKLGTNGKRWF